jgi:hypothetical protein
MLGEERGHLGVCGGFFGIESAGQKISYVVGQDRHRACTQPLITTTFAVLGRLHDDDTVTATRFAPTIRQLTERVP